jgi:hypothetical protein
VLLGAAPRAQAPAETRADASLRRFSEAVESYAELRARLEEPLPPVRWVLSSRRESPAWCVPSIRGSETPRSSCSWAAHRQRSTQYSPSWNQVSMAAILVARNVDTIDRG